MQKPQMRTGPIGTSYSDARHSVLHAQNHRWSLGPIETCNFGPKVSVLPAKTSDEGWDPYRLVIPVQITLFFAHKTTREVWDPYRPLSLVLKSMFFMHKTTDEGWNPYRLGILVQITLFCMHKRTGEALDPYRLVILIQKSPFCMQKPQVRYLTHTDL